jgi:hypothetical protein
MMSTRTRRRLEATTMNSLGIICSMFALTRVTTVTLAQATECFATIGALNNVMQTELIRIQNGAAPKDTYTFNLCNNTFLDAKSAILEPVLSNAFFVCGDDGQRQNNCVITGGTEQVRISESTVIGYPLQQLTFMGITFTSFQSNNGMTGTSITAAASSAATALFTDCSWSVRQFSIYVCVRFEANTCWQADRF